ncbi:MULTISPECIES: hypothetical protein [Synechocystis]|uniref:Uncharacterized protein n=1 Tax=Synechocystis salina LEGE 00031 TaxID=1828736 RepID=A0ABR9VQQ6_9SYNC|nr:MULTISPECIES: hypothetical protein [Synechocystis]MBD2654575.1 hypothetical protein [Synechocystis sp. FACHB-383]MBE9240170.1 hypothetical protein [Synechocystis salina LEGE 00041]MBE9253680.1 hypothetical protein [Synechocystis salina LEGE 00031]
MVTIAIHTALGVIGGLLIFAVFFYLSNAQQTSAPLGLIFLGLACGIMAHYLSPWATLVILGLYALISFKEWWGDRHTPS